LGGGIGIECHRPKTPVRLLLKWTFPYGWFVGLEGGLKSLWLNV
jgi:hypothetical protein